MSHQSYQMNAADNLFIINRQILSQEGWKAILELKQDFLKNNIQDPCSNAQINPAIAASWIRSRDMEIDPYHPAIPRSLTSQEYRKILEQYRLLIDITKPLVYTFKNMIASTDYMLELIDKKGVRLLSEGKLRLPPIAARGIIFDEHTMGTNAHTLSMRLKCPVQLVGPEHYCVDLQNINASAAPIIDETGEAIASLVLTQPLTSPTWDPGFQKLLAHTLGLITSMATAVQTQMKLAKKNENLTVMNQCLEATLACNDEGIITIDRTGKIMRLNQEGARILRMQPHDIGKKNIQEYLDHQSNLLDLAARGENTNLEENISIGSEGNIYLINIRPVLNQHSRELDAAVLRLTQTEKINLGSRSGAIANFQFKDIIGDSKALKKAIQLAQLFAGSPENILLIGESGTGKELFAQAIHNQYRPAGPFMAVNCAALPRELIESELFGYEGGSFTGAERSGKPGKIELANGGTLFLDEIGDMPLELQAVLLRVLEDKQVMRIGGRRYKKVDFRVVAATNKNLHEMVKEKLFREDLYFRLSVLPVSLPPLRNREKDTLTLSRYFLEKYSRKLGRKVPQLSPQAQKIIQSYDWPGNVRQLENAINYAINVSRGTVIEANNLPENILLDNSPVRSCGIPLGGGNVGEVLSLKKLEKAAIDLALLHSQNSIPRAADLLEISKATLYRKLKEYECEPK